MRYSTFSAGSLTQGLQRKEISRLETNGMKHISELIQWVKIAHSPLRVMSNLFHFRNIKFLNSSTSKSTTTSREVRCLYNKSHFQLTLKIVVNILLNSHQSCRRSISLLIAIFPVCTFNLHVSKTLAFSFHEME